MRGFAAPVQQRRDRQRRFARGRRDFSQSSNRNAADGWHPDRLVCVPRPSRPRTDHLGSRSRSFRGLTPAYTGLSALGSRSCSFRGLTPAHTGSTTLGLRRATGAGEASPPRHIGWRTALVAALDEHDVDPLPVIADHIEARANQVVDRLLGDVGDERARGRR